MKLAITIAAGVLMAWAADQVTQDRGQKEAGAACTPCHSLRLVESQRLSRAAWGRELDKMTGWGSKIQDREALLNYLVENFGDDKPPRAVEMTKDGARGGRRQ